MEYDVFWFTQRHMYTNSLRVSTIQCINVLKCRRECSETFTRNTIKTWTESYSPTLGLLCFLYTWCTAQPILLPHTELAYLFILKNVVALFGKSELKILGSITATGWRSANVQQPGSSTLGPTTGCFWLNKDFLLSSKVPTDAFIEAKFTLCARRKLPLFGLKVQLTYVCAAYGLFLINSDILISHSHIRGERHKSVFSSAWQLHQESWRCKTKRDVYWP